MSKDTARIAWVCTAACLLACLVAGMAGCPAGGGGANAPTPPFDASGTYTGTWTATEGFDLTCPFSLTIDQAINLPFPANFLLGVLADFPYSCILDQEILDEIVPDLPDLIVPLVGAMSQDEAGNIILSVNTEGLDLPFVLTLTYDGTGQDTDGDGVMDGFSGDYTLSLTEVEGFEDETVESVGTFDVSRPQ